ncbi:uncharacterized protein BROUX77_004119 [Berkeleyomyces rouxiae]|uniref:uncharacterized protein n=1 Tax=Berkeleyomyces rouxiae TaxID=2035830 RepID=UPI003B77583A
MIFTQTAALLALLAPFVSADRNATSVKPGRFLDNEAPACTSWYVVQQGDTCDDIINSFQMSYDDIYGLNPDIDASCTNLHPGVGLCISTAPLPTTLATTYLLIANATLLPGTGTPIVAAEMLPTEAASPVYTNPPVEEIRTGVTNECKLYHQVLPGNTCVSISANAAVALTDFMKWNDAAWSCKDLELGSYVCIGV